MIILSAYYQNEWSNAYCEETGLAEWELVFAWVGMGGVIYQLLANVWFWSINWNWKHFTTGRRRGDQADPPQEEVAGYLTEHGRAGQSRLVLLRPECALAGRTRNQPSSSSSWFVQGHLFCFSFLVVSLLLSLFLSLLFTSFIFSSFHLFSFSGTLSRPEGGE